MIACLFHGLHCVAFDLELKERNTNGITISVFSEKKLTREPSEALAQLAEDSSTAADPFPRITGRWPPSESMNLRQRDHDLSEEVCLDQRRIAPCKEASPNVRENGTCSQDTNGDMALP